MKGKSLFGPIVLIAIGALLLLHNFRPELSLFNLFAAHWPWILVAWGAFRLLELGFARLLGRPEPQPLGGGAILMALLLVLAGSIAHGVSQGSFRFSRWTHEIFQGFGVDFTFPIQDLRALAAEPKATLEVRGIPGHIRITGAGGDQVRVSGRKKTRALEQETARSRAERAHLMIEEKGGRIIVSSRPGPDEPQSPKVWFDIDVQLPREMSLRLKGADTEFDVRRLSGGVAVEDGVRALLLSEIEGPVRIEGRRLRRVRARNLASTFELGGSARNVALQDVAGRVTIRGRLSGTLEMAQLRQPVEVNSQRWKLELQELPGQLEKKASRSLSIVDARGPLKFSGEGVRRIRLENVTGDVELSGKRADISLVIGKEPPTSLQVEVGRGDIEVIFGPGAAFTVEAATGSGEIKSEFGSALEIKSKGRAATLRGATGEGPLLQLKTGRGDISLKRERPRGRERQA